MGVLASRLKEARQRKRITQAQVQRHTGINAKTLGGYENEVSEPDIKTLSKLAAFYDVSIDWLSGYTNNPKNTLSDDERSAVISILDFNDEAFLARQDLHYKGRPLTLDEKRSLMVAARVLLEKDR